MNTHVTFLTEAFEKEMPKENFINPCCFGEDCANWLAARLKERRFAVDTVFQEDWGWCFYVQMTRAQFWIGVGWVEEEKVWLVFCETISGLFKKLLGYTNPDAQTQLCIAIDDVLRNTSHIRNIKWYTKENYLRGKDAWASSSG